MPPKVMIGPPKVMIAICDLCSQSEREDIARQHISDNDGFSPKAGLNPLEVWPESAGSRVSGYFEVFSQRYERGSILVTTNLPFDEWTEVFGSERLTGALLDRLTHHVHILEMNGESYRLKRSRENAAAQAPDESDNP